MTYVVIFIIGFKRPISLNESLHVYNLSVVWCATLIVELHSYEVEKQYLDYRLLQYSPLSIYTMSCKSSIPLYVLSIQRIIMTRYITQDVRKSENWRDEYISRFTLILRNWALNVYQISFNSMPRKEHHNALTPVSTHPLWYEIDNIIHKETCDHAIMIMLITPLITSYTRSYYTEWRLTNGVQKCGNSYGTSL